MKQTVLLIDLPVYPKGVVSLSLLSVAECLAEQYDIQIFDLNISSLEVVLNFAKPVIMCGLKVSSQSFEHAKGVTAALRKKFSAAKIIWGGELPTLLPDTCLQYADAVASGLFEPIAREFMQDLAGGSLKKKYFGGNSSNALSKPDFSKLNHRNAYYTFMGLPLETSRGCTEHCIFCMVHTMQKKEYHLSSVDVLAQHLKQYKNSFVNVVDYNFGVDSQHVIQVADLIKKSGATGWMAEMCIELLDNDEMLAALQASNCKIIYCGLESIEQVSLNSVHKMNTNHIENYERIIRKVQSYGIQIAAGIILGLEGTNPQTFDNLFNFYQRMGIIYAKLTFLTYNPGTKVHEYVKKKGSFVTESISDYDGNRLTYLPDGVNSSDVTDGAVKFIKRYYSLIGIVKRSFNTRLSFLQRMEFILFTFCYSHTYREWLKYDTLHHPENLSYLISWPFNKAIAVVLAEKLLYWVRILQTKN